jgi:AraC-like DNA-binding protein
MGNSFEISIETHIEPYNAGLFVSTGKGATHVTRIIDTWEIIFVVKGKLAMFEEDKNFYLEEGDALLLHPGKKHGGLLNYPPDLSFFWLHFKVSEKLRSKLSISVPQTVNVARRDRMTEFFRLYLDDQENGRQNKLQAALTTSMILSELALPQAEDLKGVGEELANRAKKYIELHVFEKISSSEIAKKLRVNCDYLGRTYKKSTGETITQTIHRLRVKKAKELLMEQELNIAEISESCGFNDPVFFRRIFRKFTNLTPGKYRRLYIRAHINTE